MEGGVGVVEGAGPRVGGGGMVQGEQSYWRSRGHCVFTNWFDICRLRGKKCYGFPREFPC